MPDCFANTWPTGLTLRTPAARHPRPSYGVSPTPAPACWPSCATGRAKHGGPPSPPSPCARGSSAARTTSLSASRTTPPPAANTCPSPDRSPCLRVCLLQPPTAAPPVPPSSASNTKSDFHPTRSPPPVRSARQSQTRGSALATCRAAVTFLAVVWLALLEIRARDPPAPALRREARFAPPPPRVPPPSSPPLPADRQPGTPWGRSHRAPARSSQSSAWQVLSRRRAAAHPPAFAAEDCAPTAAGQQVAHCGHNGTCGGARACRTCTPTPPPFADIRRQPCHPPGLPPRTLRQHRPTAHTAAAQPTPPASASRAHRPTSGCAPHAVPRPTPQA